MRKWWFLLALALLGACSKQGQDAATTPAPPIGIRHFDPVSIAHGARLFEEHCAQCHGPQAQGHPDWQTPSEGKFAAAPPLNGTGNDWKRSRAELAVIIRNGVRRKSDNADIMPSWKGRIGENDIDDVINWLQSLWPAEVYEAWTRAHGDVPAPKS
jgi:mono/diheme cytochrome c family protein